MMCVDVHFVNVPIKTKKQTNYQILKFTEYLILQFKYWI